MFANVAAGSIIPSAAFRSRGFLAGEPCLVERFLQSFRLGFSLRRSNDGVVRSHAACGFAFENFDPIGRWRVKETNGLPVDARAKLRDGTEFVGIDGLRERLLAKNAS